MKEIPNTLVITDSMYKKKPMYSMGDRLLMRFINDPRDLPFMYFLVQATLIIVPLIVLLYIVAIPWYFAALYVPFNIFLFMDRFILLLHNTSHRPLFRKKYQILNLYIVWILGPLFGESPETYFVHHIGMHHVEENLEADLSSTMSYKRDSFIGWLKYFFRFFFGTLFELSFYMAKKGRRKLLIRIVAGELTFFILVALLCVINPVATLFVFILPFIFCRFAMIAGNWAQHAFIDSSRPEDPFASSITLINCRYNRRCYNDGYHIGHHRKARLHWTELPLEFQEHRELYKSQGAIVFAGIDFLMIWILLMFKRYDILARHFVDLQNPRRSIKEVIALLKNRTKAIPVR